METTVEKTWTLREIKQANKDAGLFYFSPDTMRFFRSRVSEIVHQGPGGVYLVTSEQNHGYGGPYRRLYTVRRFDPATGKVETADDDGFQAYKTSTGARERAKALATKVATE